MFSPFESKYNFFFLFQNLFGTSPLSASAVSSNFSESSEWTSSSLPPTPPYYQDRFQCPTPPYYQDRFQGGEIPFEVNRRDVASLYNNFGATSRGVNASDVASLYNNFGAASRGVNESGIEPNRYLPRGIRNRAKFNCCVFCKKNGEDER